VKTIATKIDENENFNNLRLRPKRILLTLVIALGVPAVLPAGAAHAQGNARNDIVPPLVFQAAGPTADSIRSTIDTFRAVPGFENNNGNNPPPLDRSGRREINWDGGNPSITATTTPVTPFNVFLNNRGSQFTTPGVGLSQVALSGLAALFNNPTYDDGFSVFSASRLFTPVGSNITEALFFVPGSNGRDSATVRGFGAVFTDIDRPDGSGPGKKKGNREASTLMEYFDAYGNLLFSSFVPAAPGDGGLSFLGIVFDDARIARVRITAGDVAPGPDDDAKNDIVLMDDFIYGEPQPLQ
jgi:hypothetical protein